MQVISKLSIFIALALTLSGGGVFAAPVPENIIAIREDDFNPFSALKAIAKVVTPLLKSLPAPIKSIAAIANKVAPAGSDVAKLTEALAAREDDGHAI